MKADIAIIRESFEAISPYKEDVMNHFYETLFERHPDARTLFSKTDMEKQRNSLASSLAHIIESWEKKAEVATFLKNLGRRHLKYGLQPEHMEWVGEAMLSTLAYFFEHSWTAEVEAHWKAFYGTISDLMLEGVKTDMTIPENDIVAQGPSIELVESVCNSPTLERIVRMHARDILNFAISEELEYMARTVAREKAQGILKDAIETEVQQVCAQLKQKTQAA